MDDVIKWLLEGPPYVAYRTLLDLLELKEEDQKVLKAKEEIMNDPLIQSLLKELCNWPGTVLSSHKSANQSFHKLSFLADIGLTINDPYIDGIVKKILKHQSGEGPFQLPMNIPVHFGGSGNDEWAWALCDAPIILYSLVKFGLENESEVQKGIKYLVELAKENGWPCAVSKELGKFRGPGKKDDPCPYATLVMLKLLSELENYNKSKEVTMGKETLLNLWSNSKDLHPYMFYMGRDFRKLKAPLFWYDILNVLDTLSKFSYLKREPALKEMVEVVKAKADKDGRYHPESIYKVWKDWEFSDKKKPSRWITFLVKRILKRIE